ncbi:hypothetical protein [Deinococcus sp. Leaf326]|uniref:hypothetical protein n=1 Tax=Deinococcus sp. Leaf326 TaxID=1736338 RepID=UPI0006F87859|nr:hypothetical protein [Deinococcus sp. Leaf326]KQR08729.1 hypothetical protein ASF71_09380 [Deinococcus sp. Leaf326]
MPILYPDLGDLLRLHPQFNAGTVAEALRAAGLRELWWASSDDADHPLRDALPAAGITLRGEGELAPDWRWADTERAQLEAFLSQYPQGRERLRAAGAAEAALSALLSLPLTPERVLSPEMLAGVRAYHEATRAALDEGPGTRWQARRLGELAARLGSLEGAVLVPLDDLPGLLEHLPTAALPDLGSLVPGETSRLRALADRAWQLREDDDLPALFAALTREAGDAVTPLAELRAAAGGLALAAGELSEARMQLEAAAHALRGDEPRSLPGLVLVRLGQVRDAQGDRDLALRTYRAVLALTYAPEVALETARSGLDTPFGLGE